jgi:hypothetical protein
MPKPMPVKNDLICQAIKCPDCLVDDGPPAWCTQAGIPAEVAKTKCPKLADKREEGKDE